MNMNYRSLTLSILLGMIVHFAVEAQTLPEKQFFHPDRVKYDKDCFTIEGKDILYSVLRSITSVARRNCGVTASGR